MKLTKAYMAGVADSDGSFSVALRHRNRPNPTYQAMFQLTWTKTFRSESAFKQLVAEYGGSFFEQKLVKEEHYKNSRATIKYTLTGQKLKRFLKDIRPYVMLKYDQIDNLLELLNTTENFKYGFGRPKPEELKQSHHNLYLKNKKLNTKNSSNRRKNEGI